MLSYRTASFSRTLPLGPLDQSSASEITLHLAACLLHELRLGEDSRWYGWLQMIPRDGIALPTFWGDGVSQIGGPDGQAGLQWLRGTRGEMELARKEEEGLSLVRGDAPATHIGLEMAHLTWAGRHAPLLFFHFPPVSSDTSPPVTERVPHLPLRHVDGIDPSLCH